jgi:hypothetical protein
VGGEDNFGTGTGHNRRVGERKAAGRDKAKRR